MSDSSSEVQTPTALETTLARKWVIKMAVFLIVLVGFGIYGLYDATVAYPNRGEKSASWHLHQYLLRADAALILEDDLTVPEGTTPAQQHADLESRLGDLTRTSEGTSLRAKGDAAEIGRYHWLGSLRVLGKLSSDRIADDLGESPRDTLLQLNEKWATTTNQPKPLASYDIPVQWVFTIVGLGGGALMLLHIARIASKKYTWNPDELRLGLPGGASVVPADVEVFDRRKWDKFLIFLKVNAEHKELGGQEIKLDLYQYQPLEEWYKAMHEHARPEDFEDDEADEAEQDDAPESEEDQKPQDEG